MAKSIRAKNKMASRARKRLQSHYAVSDAARTQRLSDKLLGKDKKDGEEEMNVEGGGEREVEENKEGDEEMKEEPKKVSTSGRRGSRREQWRLSKGMSAKPKKSRMGCKPTRRR
ncbi:hypothetical protein L486_06641 [Kwoniella mangroviensis CBS 10435]|uniref:DUF2423 domain-containing protein n=1 Tax=Kwoniella mangroviensis CBS 10435 TaxID=1331196 RepID=A0A1B9IK04_9TREE|nr:uncharacterized protein I203_05340 [Kwoniella mangroviensis CBS 8507]OCF55885.1 hypothetical protein L486_06641 [Kwoniella mangroviensis CBS 10435]OCF65660.1 hypothetical protein I203_05340 [Kwoniella mangroviensis CBS 8507]OCF71618.1 hypothetical protein I204_07677 [Kwoniella mangroviensis CBS 8886]